MALQLYLASSSPRRQQLLQQIGIAYEVVNPQADETQLPGEPARDYVQRVAAAKAGNVAERVSQQNLPEQPVLAADTCVVIDGEILGKPKDIQDGLRMLRLLSGKSHQVYSGIALLHEQNLYTTCSETEVRFAPLSEAVMTQYWESGEPHDKAGGYAIQGLGGKFVSAITGSYSGVVGLPLYELQQLLKQAGLVDT